MCFPRDRPVIGELNAPSTRLLEILENIVLLAFSRTHLPFLQGVLGFSFDVGLSHVGFMEGSSRCDHHFITK